MSAVQALKAARAAGVRLGIDGEDLTLEADAAPRPKTGVIALLRQGRDGWETMVFPLSPPSGERRCSGSRAASGADAATIPIVAVASIGRAYDSRAMVAVAAMHADRAARTNASRPVRASRAGGGVGFGDLNREQAQNQQTGSNCLHHHHVSLSSIVLHGRASAATVPMANHEPGSLKR
jgi:hypothetical protein